MIKKIKKIKPIPGVLSKLLEEKNLNKSSFLEDPKTLNKIDKGYEVKETTLQDVADAIGVNIEEFIKDDDYWDYTEDNDDILRTTNHFLKQENRLQEVALKNVDKNFSRILINSDSVNWFFDIEKVDAKLAHSMEEIKEQIAIYKDPDPLEDPLSFNNQLEKITLTNQLNLFIKEIETKNKLRLKYANYSFYWHDITKVDKTLYIFASNYILISIFDESLNFKRAEVDIGLPKEKIVKETYQQLYSKIFQQGRLIFVNDTWWDDKNFETTKNEWLKINNYA